MAANSRDRSKFIKVKHNAATESYKRSAHNDFATSSELAKRKFSGVRENSITKDREIWLEGECLAKVSPADLKLNPNAFAEAYSQVFALPPPEPDSPIILS